MRWLAVVWPLLLVGCASVTLAPQPRLSNLQTLPSHPPHRLERPWLVPKPADEIVLFDTRTLQALRKLDETPALNANGDRDVKVAMWIGIGVGTAVAINEVVDAIDDTADTIAEDFFGCFFDMLFGDDCEEDD